MKIVDAGQPNEWKEQAKALFFIEHLGITEIAASVGRVRETVSRFINACDGYDDEIEFRKKQSADRRKDYQLQWDRDNRSTAYRVTDDSVKREHITAVRILSAEKY
jgi:hypothetical protein